MMPAGPEHTVLCVRCRRSAVTVLVYPERACGERGLVIAPGGKLHLRTLEVSCTLTPDTCQRTWHLDVIANQGFLAVRPGLRKIASGRTGKA